MTPNIERLRREVERRWSNVKSWGVQNCRKIANTTIWSQHAWGNAWDLTSPSRVLIAGPRTRYNPLHMRYVDRIHEYLDANRNTLEIRTLLWRTAAHWDHIHVDTWRKGWGTPPCAGGTLRTKDKAGNVWPDWGEEDMAAAVEGIQRNLNAAGYRDPDGEPLTVDGEWGPKTEYAHAAMCADAASPDGLVPHRHQVPKTGPALVGD